MNNFFKFQKNIIKTIEKNLFILNKFLLEFDISQDYPIEEFLIDSSLDIYNSWIINNINFESLNLNKIIEHKNFPDAIKDYISLNSKNKFKTICLTKNSLKGDKFDTNIKLVKDNYEILENLIFKEIEIDYLNNFLSNDYFKKYGNFKNLKNLKVINSNILNFESKINCQLAPIFPSIEKLIFKKNLMNLKLIDEVFYRNTKKLNKIVFKECSLVNENIAQIFNMMKEMDNLESIDLSHNHLTYFNIEQYQNTSCPLIFQNVLNLNLQHNNIYSIKINQYLPELKILDISSNDICQTREIELYKNFYGNKCLILANRNQCMMNNLKFTNNYIKYLAEMLELLEINIKRLDLSFLGIYDKQDNYFANTIESLIINQTVQISIKKLIFSYSNINQKTLDFWFSKNTKFINLKKICLKSNHLNDNFIESLIFKDIYKNLDNLESIDLTENLIANISSLDNIWNLFNQKNKINSINLSLNDIETLLNKLIIIFLIKDNINNVVDDESEMGTFMKFNNKMKNINFTRSFKIILSKKFEENFLKFIEFNGFKNIFFFE